MLFFIEKVLIYDFFSVGCCRFCKMAFKGGSADVVLVAVYFFYGSFMLFFSVFCCDGKEASVTVACGRGSACWVGCF